MSLTSFIIISIDDKDLLQKEHFTLKEKLLEIENSHLDEINHLKDEISKNEGKVKELELKLATDEVYIKNKEMEYDALKESQGYLLHRSYCSFFFILMPFLAGLYFTYGR
jgi:TolA-binding protein